MAGQLTFSICFDLPRLSSCDLKTEANPFVEITAADSVQDFHLIPFSSLGLDSLPCDTISVAKLRLFSLTANNYKIKYIFV